MGGFLKVTGWLEARRPPLGVGWDQSGAEGRGPRGGTFSDPENTHFQGFCGEKLAKPNFFFGPTNEHVPKMTFLGYIIIYTYTGAEGAKAFYSTQKVTGLRTPK